MCVTKIHIQEIWIELIKWWRKALRYRYTDRGIKLPHGARVKSSCDWAVGEKARETSQVRNKEMSESEPTEEVSKELCYIKTRIMWRRLGWAWKKSVYWPGGVRHIGGMNLFQAFNRNVRTCHSDVKGEIRRENPEESEYQSRVQGRISS